MGKLQKIDNKINLLIKSGVESNHRSMIVMFGEKSQDQVPILHHIYQNISKKPSSRILWCYKKDLAFSTHRQKNMKLLNNRRKAGLATEGTIFEQFICANSIRWCYYSETQNILGQTFDICVLQDFEALTPNCLARTIETVEGGGIIVFIMKSVTSLRQFCTMAMDVHTRYRTQANQDIVPRFNERFLLSLAFNKRCLVLDDKWKIFPLSLRTLKLIEDSRDNLNAGISQNTEELNKLKISLKEDGSFFEPIVNLCVTLCQARCILQGAKSIAKITKKEMKLFPDNESFSKAILVITASRGRGKSAALGLCLAMAIEAGLPNIYATAPAPENLSTSMDFCARGLKELGYQEHIDFNVVRDSELNSIILQIEITKRSYRQTVSYINPWSAAKQACLNVESSDLMIIDEAASIPLVLLKKIIQSPKLVFMASTVNGYEGTGRSLSYKLLKELRSKCKVFDKSVQNNHSSEKDSNLKPFDNTTALFECTMNDAIRYGENDNIESWLNNLLCLDCELILNKISSPNYYPPIDQCQLYYINRDTLFSYHDSSEKFLKSIMALYVASHYKNSPDDLQMLSDAPSHNLFCLLPPYNEKSGDIPEVLVVIQVCMEGKINQDIIMRSLARGFKPAGDLIPWIISQQFCCNEFGSLSGARIIRIATHPNYQGIGYGTRAIQLLTNYYSKPCISKPTSSPLLPTTYQTCDLEESENQDIQEICHGKIKENGKFEKMQVEEFTEKSFRKDEKGLPPLLSRLNERPNETLDYLGVSFGITPSIVKFWKRSNFHPIYISQKLNPITAEYSCVMIRRLTEKKLSGINEDWDHSFFRDFSNRFFNLCPGPFRCLDTTFALDLVLNKKFKISNNEEINKCQIEKILSTTDMKRLHLYVNSLVDYPVINDLVPTLSKLFFNNNLPNLRLTITHQIVLFGLGLQHKTFEEIAHELERNSHVSDNKLARKSELIDQNAFTSVISNLNQFSNLSNNDIEDTKKVSNNKTREESKQFWPRRVKGFFFSIIKEIVDDIERIMKINYDNDEELNEMKQTTRDENGKYLETEEINQNNHPDLIQVEQESIDQGEIDKRKKLVMELLTEETSTEQLESCSLKVNSKVWNQNTLANGKDLNKVKIFETDLKPPHQKLQGLKKTRKRKPDDSEFQRGRQGSKKKPKRKG